MKNECDENCRHERLDNWKNDIQSKVVFEDIITFKFPSVTKQKRLKDPRTKIQKEEEQQEQKNLVPRMQEQFSRLLFDSKQQPRRGERTSKTNSAEQS